MQGESSRNPVIVLREKVASLFGVLIKSIDSKNYMTLKIEDNGRATTTGQWRGLDFKLKVVTQAKALLSGQSITY
jgi:hypothetical protein